MNENEREFFTLVDEDGSEIEFEKIGEITLNEKVYFAMIPAEAAENAAQNARSSSTPYTWRPSLRSGTCSSSTCSIFLWFSAICCFISGTEDLILKKIKNAKFLVIKCY